MERTAAEDLEPEQELLTINMGPHHPATHGVVRAHVDRQQLLLGLEVLGGGALDRRRADEPLVLGALERLHGPFG